jgi:type 1 glutamine amidotransferase/predicted phosphodiesterase
MMIIRLLTLSFLISISISLCQAQHEWQKPKPLISENAIEKIVGPLTKEAPSKDLNIVWVWGYDGGHRPGAHDYLRVRDLMTGLLRQVPRVSVETAYLFPSKEQLAKADLVAMYLHLPQLTYAQYADFQAYIQRGGGVVALHETAIMRPASEGKKLAECLGMAWDEGRSQWGAIFEDITIENRHEIFLGFPNELRIVDEFYWHLNQLDGVDILGTVRTGPPTSSRGLLPPEELSKEASPMFWTLKSGKGRVFGTTTGHNTFTYYDPEFRIIVFRAMAWAMKERADPFLRFVAEGITDENGMVGTTDDMRDWEGKLREPPKEDEVDLSSFQFAQMCDTQLGLGGYAHGMKTFELAVTQLNALKPDFVLICGDLVNNASDRTFDDFNRIKDGFKIPCHCAAGNHDVEKVPTAASLERYREKIGKDYYAIDHKGYHFVIGNTQLWKSPLAGESQKHDAWFRKTLASAKEKNLPVVVVVHYPLFVEHPNEPESYSNLPIKKRRELLSLFEASGVVAVLAGHTHTYVENEYKGIQMVCGETTSRNFDQRPLGFRMWKAEKGGKLSQRFVKLDGLED